MAKADEALLGGQSALALLPASGTLVFGQILVEFLFRLTFGVAAAMGLTSSRDVTGGFFRVHLWVLMGLQTLAALALYSADVPSGKDWYTAYGPQFALAIAAAAGSYLGAVLWMYEQRWLGKAFIWMVAGAALAACLAPAALGHKSLLWPAMDRITGGLLLGLLTTAMLLGHWYLNTPTMKLGPLKRLIVLLAAAASVRMAVCFGGAWLAAVGPGNFGGMSPTTWGLFLALRWLSGLVGLLGLAWLTWQTLKIPNTQSATGILYAGVVVTFIGELTSQLLSAQSHYPV